MRSAGDVPAPQMRLGVTTYLMLGAFAALSPLSTVFVLPALPQLASDLEASLSQAQLSISAGLIGLAAGQLFIGPISDRVGRRRPLIVGLLLYVTTTALCALAPNIVVLLALRLLQGFSGAAAWVIARAAVRDLYAGASAARVFSQLMLVTGLAPILSPLLAGQLLRVTDWRGLFWVLAGAGAVVTVLAALRMKETLQPDLRHSGNLASQLRVMGDMLLDPYFRAFIGLAALQASMYFTYVIMSPFVLQQEFGMTPQSFSIVFGANAVAMILGSQVNARLVGRWSPSTLLRAQTAIMLVGCALLTVVMLADAPLPVVIGFLFIVPTCSGAAISNITALGLTPYGHAAGAAAALLGGYQFLYGAVVPPLVSLLGVSGVTMAATMLAAAAGSWVMTVWMRCRIAAPE